MSVVVADKAIGGLVIIAVASAEDKVEDSMYKYQFEPKAPDDGPVKKVGVPFSSRVQSKSSEVLCTQLPRSLSKLS